VDSAVPTSTKATVIGAVVGLVMVVYPNAQPAGGDLSR